MTPECLDAAVHVRQTGPRVLGLQDQTEVCPGSPPGALGLDILKPAHRLHPVPPLLRTAGGAGGRPRDEGSAPHRDQSRLPQVAYLHHPSGQKSNQST